MTHHRDGQVPLRRSHVHRSSSPETPLDPMSALAQHFAGSQASLMFSALPGAPVVTDRQRQFPALRRSLGALLAARRATVAPRSMAASPGAAACPAGTAH